jgi:hypothetical protein
VGFGTVKLSILLLGREKQLDREETEREEGTRRRI